MDFDFDGSNVKGRDEVTMEDETSFLGWEKGQASKSILPHAYPRKERARARSKGKYSPFIGLTSSSDMVV
jgi:hypothetical protein